KPHTAAITADSPRSSTVTTRTTLSTSTRTSSRTAGRTRSAPTAWADTRRAVRPGRAPCRPRRRRARMAAVAAADMPDFLTLYASAQPGKLAVVDDRPGADAVAWTYAQLEAEANRLANALASLACPDTWCRHVVMETRGISTKT